ncbi:hypothetical protein FHR76_001648 [Rhizobium sp. RAS22]|nr:hypothetical protein [Rhizobium sp. RAS22]
MDTQQFIEWLATPAATAPLAATTFVVGGVLGFLARTLTTTPAERDQKRQRLYENGRRHKEELAKSSTAFTNALQAYVNKKNAGGDLSLDDFQSISTAGNLYFNEMKMACDAILANSVDAQSRNTIVTAAAEATNKNIPLYYDTLQKIAQRIGCEYNGEFRRSNYECVYQVIEKYASSSVMPAVRG